MSNNTSSLKQVPVHEETIFGHPKGLFILFFTELWERFSYYGMRGLFVLFLTAQVAEGGWGWSDADALSLYGTYTMLVYLVAIPGGIIADRLIGQKKSVLIGGLLLVAGHSVMAIPTEWAFYSALALIILGVGLLKPNISTMVGGLYKKEDQAGRDKGFSIFYIGINLGAFLAGISCAVVAKEFGWHYGFGLAGIGMLLGQVVYMYGQKYLVHVGNFEKKTESKKSNPSKPLTKVEKDRLVVLLLSFLIVIIFWGAFEQAGGLMNLYAENKINLNLNLGFLIYDVPAAAFQSLNALYIILLGVPIAAFWALRKQKSKESSALFKMGIGTIIMGLGFVFMMLATKEVSTSESGEILQKAGMQWLFLAYLFHTVGELCLSPVALSFITKMSPAKYASMMMGVYFAMTGLGNKLAASLGSSAKDLGDYNTFLLIASVSVVFGLIVLVFLKPLKKLTHGAEDTDSNVVFTEEEQMA
ncbi:peptide MFS transporter [Aureibacter tunicatorum]|uniref:POT family proton-dependent oligopeptide transporter n=1 Tax=Aureibacter tunicatorum TaxID=866807 RepID=A0AAE3XTM4_9BACT|nr:peptide MFS transporter [Aureibacter tunicatorum]MDR6241651.1 POT family proton-dependent oligopeptide transporter [Aureibacter tunicatorum]BDD07363.1 MFS transporter [Aureibacter tunicatorum]